jgi:hypothetical protein
MVGTKPQSKFETDLIQVLNANRKENESNTPDFILANYLIDCLKTFNKASKRREQWYGKSLLINGDGGGNVRKFHRNNYRNNL